MHTFDAGIGAFKTNVCRREEIVFANNHSCKVATQKNAAEKVHHSLTALTNMSNSFAVMLPRYIDHDSANCLQGTTASS